MPPNTTAIPTPAHNTSAVQTYLNDIYKGANVEFTISSDITKFDLGTGANVGLQRSDESVFGKYSLEMRALKSAYMAFDADYNKKASYIFVVPAFTGSGTLSGFMVRGRSVGFITSSADNRTIAHELGHGVFGLEHTFPEIAQGTSNNLMDYVGTVNAASNTHLTHEQWKIIHARKPAYSWFDTEEDGSVANFVVGAVVGGVVDLLVQVLEVYINEDAKGTAISSVSLGTVVNGISWSSVGLSMAFGAGGNVAGMATKFRNFANTPGGKKVARIAIEAVTDFILDATEDIIKEYVATGEVKNVAETLISSALFSSAGGLLDGVASKIRTRFGIKKPPVPRATSIAKKIEKSAIQQQKDNLAGFKAKIPNKTHADGIETYLADSYKPEVGFKALNEDIGKWMGNSKLVALLADYHYYAAFYQQIGSDKYKLKIASTVEELILWIIGLKEFKETREKVVFVGMPTASVDAIDNAIDKLCTITNVSTRININAKLAGTRFTSAEVRAFLEDVNVSTTDNNHIANNVGNLDVGTVEAWNYLYKNQEDKSFNARKNWQALNSFKQLNADVKSYIVKFGDKASTMTLTRFCLDLDKNFSPQDSQKFLTYCNDTENLNIVKNFVGHKLDDTDFERVSEEYIDNSLNGLAKTWTQRSIKMAALQENGEDGRFYGKRAVVALINGTLDLGITTITQSEYTVFNEVQLWVDKAKDQYMIADILLVKFNALGQIDDVIICESKLSAGTDYTKRQKQGWRLINAGTSLEVKANKKNSLSTGGEGSIELIAVINLLNININKVKRISDAGNKNGAFNVANIPVSNYSTYQAKN